MDEAAPRTGVDPTLTTDLDVETEFAPWDGRRVPVTLLGGYLGAGKTTVVNRLLARTERPIAVMVNDVGTIGIDHRLISRHHGDVVELTDGCVCCSLSQGLAQAFDDLRARPTAPDHLLIELSGVADPTQVAPWARSPGFHLDAVVVLVDAERHEAQAANPLVGPLIERQLAAADLVVVTKLDLVDPGPGQRLVERLRADAGGRPVIPATDPEALAGLLDTATRQGGVAVTPPPSLFDVHRTTTVAMPDPIDPVALDRLLADLDPAVIRAKGVARAPDGARLLVQVVGRRRSVTPLPAAEDEPPTDLVVISLG